MASDSEGSARRLQEHPDPFGEEQQESLTEEELAMPMVVLRPQLRPFDYRHACSGNRQRVVHLLFSVLTFVFLLLSLSCVWWRVLHVNREALSLMQEIGEVDEKLLNTTLAFSRAQTLTQECFVSDDDVVLREKGLPEKACHSLIPKDSPKPHQEYFHIILPINEIQIYAASFVITVAGLLTLIELFTWFMHPLNVAKMFKVMTFIRCANLAPTLLILILGFILSHLYNAENPGYPRPWPKVIRKLTHLYAWQFGPVLWTTGFCLQIATKYLDQKIIRTFNQEQQI